MRGVAQTFLNIVKGFTYFIKRQPSDHIHGKQSAITQSMTLHQRSQLVPMPSLHRPHYEVQKL